MNIFRKKTEKNMMHNERNTDIDIIKRNYELRKDKTNSNNCVLIITGSFNPIHRSHLKNLRLVRDYLENHQVRPMNVLAAYLSPTHDSYVHQKLGDSDWIPADIRCKLCRDAIKSENLDDFVSVSQGESRYEKGFVDFDEVSMRLAKFLNSTLCGSDKLLDDKLTVVYVCGLDHFNKCPYVQRLAKEKYMACAVIYRLGAPDDYIKKLEETSSNIYYMSLEDERNTLVDISSTAIRKRYRTPNNTDTDELSYSCVIDYYKKKLSDK